MVLSVYGIICLWYYLFMELSVYGIICLWNYLFMVFGRVIYDILPALAGGFVPVAVLYLLTSVKHILQVFLLDNVDRNFPFNSIKF